MLLAEDLLLLLTDDETGKLAAEGSEVDVALGGALLIELVLMGRVDVAGPDAARRGRLRVEERGPTGDDLLDEALATVVEREGKKPQSVVERLGKRVRPRLYERLTETGVLRAEEAKVLGVFPRHRWPAADTAHESSVRAGIESALREGSTRDERMGALVALLHALRVIHEVVEPAAVGLSTKELKANAQRIAEGDWAAQAVRQAIDSTNAAIYTVIFSTGAAGGGASS